MSPSTPSATPAPSVPLRNNASDRNSQSLSSSKPPVWSLDESSGPEPTPLPAKCARHGRPGNVCCKDLKGDDDRTLVDPDIVRDVVIGLSDGLTVPFALSAGLSSLGESRLVVLGGIAELIAGAISMGIGGFLASQAEQDHYRYQFNSTRARVERSCAGEMEREVFGVLGPVGVSEKVSRMVAGCLSEVEYDSAGVGSRGSARSEEEGSLRWSKEVGLTAFLLKFGQGMEDIPTRRLYISAFTIGMGYLIGGLIPLLPYLFIPVAHIALLYSCLLTGLVLLVFGAVKARVTGAGLGLGGYVWGAVSTLLVGGAAAGAAYGIVYLLETK